MVLRCFCEHAGQDELHGDDKRVHNEMAPKPKMPTRYRCTVCKRDRTAKEGK